MATRRVFPMLFPFPAFSIPNTAESWLVGWLIGRYTLAIAHTVDTFCTRCTLQQDLYMTPASGDKVTLRDCLSRTDSKVKLSPVSVLFVSLYLSIFPSLSSLLSHLPHPTHLCPRPRTDCSTIPSSQTPLALCRFYPTRRPSTVRRMSRKPCGRDV